jgi:hypothetical protein
VLRSTSSAAALSASTGVTAQDKVDRLEARTAFRAPEPDAQLEAVAEPGGPQAAGVAAEPGARQAAVVVSAPDAQREAAAPDAAVAAEPDAQQAAVEPDAAVAAAEPDAQQAVVAVLDAQQAAAVAAASDVQQAAVLAPIVGAVKLRVRPLVVSVEPAEMAAVRLWSRPVLFLAPAPERRVVSAARVQAAADR